MPNLEFEPVFLLGSTAIGNIRRHIRYSLPWHRRLLSLRSALVSSAGLTPTPVIHRRMLYCLPLPQIPNLKFEPGLLLGSTTIRTIRRHIRYSRPWRRRLLTLRSALVFSVGLTPTPAIQRRMLCCLPLPQMPNLKF